MKEYTVLFVCVHNSGRSLMAEAFLNDLATALRLAVRALSAGTMPGSAVNPLAVAVMAEIGIPIEGHPRPLTQRLADTADRIVSMGCGVDAASCPARFLIAEDWELEDPAGQPIEKVREIRDQIRHRVETLAGDLQGLVSESKNAQNEGAS